MNDCQIVVVKLEIVVVKLEKSIVKYLNIVYNGS